ncbi:MAG: crossover junction endodeoxyribonuclease RuvC [Candidatus Paceibacterota bacterium]
MRVLAIDPGYDRLGMAVMDKINNQEKLVYSCCVETSKKDTVAKRIHQIGEVFEKLILKYKPDIVAMETLFFSKNQKTAMAVAETRGVITFLATRNSLEVREFGPGEIKVAVTGYGSSDKRAVMEMLKRLVPNLPPKALDDEYDAIAVAVTALAHSRD